MLILDKICPRTSYSYSASKLKLVEEDRKDRLPSLVRGSSGSMIRETKEKEKGNVKGMGMGKGKGEARGDRDRCRGNPIDVHGQDSERTGCTDIDTDDIFNDDGCRRVRAFGQRKYGMSQATWTLIILSRRCAEQVMMTIIISVIIITTRLMTMTII